MRQQVDVLPLGDGAYAATVTEGETTTHHRVTISEAFVEDLAIVDLDRRKLVTELMNYLLERIPATAVPGDVDADHLSHQHDDVLHELALRLAP